MDSPETSLREEVDAAGGRLELGVEELARRFGFARMSARRIAMIDEALASAGVSAEPPLSTDLVRTVLAHEARAETPAERLWSDGAPEIPAQRLWSDGAPEIPAQRLWSEELAEMPAERPWSDTPAEMPAAAALAPEPAFIDAPPSAAAVAEVDDAAGPPAWLWWTFITALILVIAVATILGSRIG